MTYRTIRKTTKSTEFTCCTCKYVQIIEKIYKYKNVDEADNKLVSCFVKCCADNAVTREEFNAKHFYCTEHKGFGELSENEIQKNLDAKREKEADVELREYAKKYICKKDRKAFIEKVKAERKKR